MNVGLRDDAHISALSASFECGSFVEISIRVSDEGVALIENAAFRSNGCGYAVAAADVLCSWLSGKQLTELNGLGESELANVISGELGTFPQNRLHCEQLPFEALRRVMAGHRQRRAEEFQGESVLVCTCFGISEDSIVAAIAANGVTDPDGLADVCGAGSGCGSCRMLIQELIDSVAVRTGQ